MSVLDDLRAAVLRWLSEEGASGARWWNARLLRRRYAEHGVAELEPLEMVQMARVFYRGLQPLPTTRKHEEWLKRHPEGDNTRFGVNVCDIVVRAYRERIALTSVGVVADDSVSERDAEEVEGILARYAIPEATWKELIDAVLVDGIAFLYIDYNPNDDGSEGGQVEYRVERLAVPEEFGGDGQGIIPVFDDEGQQYPVAFRRVWKQIVEHPLTHEEVEAWFMTDFREGVIRRYVRWPNDESEGWEPYPDPEHYIIPWVLQTGEMANVPGESSGEGGRPLDEATAVEERVSVDGNIQDVSQEEDEGTAVSGVPLPPPIVAFWLPGMRSVLENIIPLQRMLDKVWLNMMVATDWSGVGLMVFLGWVPTTDGKPLKSDLSNLLRPVPGDWLSTTRHRNEADVKTVFPAMLEGLLSVEGRIMARVAAESGVPLSMFVDTRQVAAEGTLKQQMEGLVARVREMMLSLEEGVHRYAEALLAQVVAFGGETYLDDWRGFRYEPVWANPEVRDENESIDRAIKKVERLGFDLKEVWRTDLGLTQDQVDEMIENPFAQAIYARAEAERARAEADSMMGSG